MKANEELERIRTEYARRAADSRLSGLYEPQNPATLFLVRSRQQSLAAMLRQEGISSLAGLLILEVGCGSGGELLRFLGCGALPHLLHGLDLLEDRVAAARMLGPDLHFVLGDAGHLPYADEAFDVVTQFTVLSSILDGAFRRRVASEMLRVLHPGGLILWYDFWLNPTNKATRGIRPAEIKQLFPHCAYRFRQVTLAPPIARFVVPRSRLAAQALELLPFLRTHYLATIRKVETSHA